MRAIAIPEELRAIIVRAQQGDSMAFEELLERFYVPVFSLLCKWTGNWHDAEDLTQDTFLKAYKYLKKFRIDENFKSWLYRIALNLTHDYNNQKRNLPGTAPLDEEIIRNIHFSHESPDRRIYQEQILKAIYTLLPEFTARERSVFILKTMEGMENDEIAKVLGISPTTVRRFYGLVRQKILLHFERIKLDEGK